MHFQKPNELQRNAGLLKWKLYPLSHFQNELVHHYSIILVRQDDISELFEVKPRTEDFYPTLRFIMVATGFSSENYLFSHRAGQKARQDMSSYT